VVRERTLQLIIVMPVNAGQPGDGIPQFPRVTRRREGGETLSSPRHGQDGWRFESLAATPEHVFYDARSTTPGWCTGEEFKQRNLERGQLWAKINRPGRSRLRQRHLFEGHGRIQLGCYGT
jgi:hypothetical protein